MRSVRTTAHRFSERLPRHKMVGITLRVLIAALVVCFSAFRIVVDLTTEGAYVIKKETSYGDEEGENPFITTYELDGKGNVISLEYVDRNNEKSGCTFTNDESGMRLSSKGGANIPIHRK